MRLGAFPLMMKPPIIVLSPGSTFKRTEIFAISAVPERPVIAGKVTGVITLMPFGSRGNFA